MDIEFIKWFIENHYILAFFIALMIYYTFCGILNTICIIVRGRPMNYVEKYVEKPSKKEEDTIGK